MFTIVSPILVALLHDNIPDCSYNHRSDAAHIPDNAMPVTEIILLRHGHRLAWTLDPTTGKYTSSHPYPTRLPADPPLASHGVDQAKETGHYLAQSLLDAAKLDRLRIYSSLFYRCLETVRPTIEKLQKALDESSAPRRKMQVRGERGMGEWFGHAWFKQPAPASPRRLKRDFFPWLDDTYDSLLIPSEHGERIEELHQRIANTLELIVKDVDEEYSGQDRGEEEVTVLICGHAAQIIAAGRALTGLVPDDYDEEDFKCFTCGISRFARRQPSSGEGVAGGWGCVLNSDCRHLSQGEERGWHFHGDESFDSYGAGMLGPVTSDGGTGTEEEKRKRLAEGSSKL